MTSKTLLPFFAAAIAGASTAGCIGSNTTEGCESVPEPSITVPVSRLEVDEDGGPRLVEGGAPLMVGSATTPPYVGESFDYSLCPQICPDERPMCWITSLDGGEATLSCSYDCTGRRPHGCRSVAIVAGQNPLGAHFARMAALEAASVDAFRDLARELRRHGAPRALIEACRRAARDEVRHARRTGALARRFGGVPASTHLTPAPARSLEELAHENAREGCVRETFGALLAAWQARAARDPDVRAALARIARDEARHAQLSWSIDAWARGRLPPAARQRVAEAKRAAARELATRVAAPEPRVAVVAGIPSAEVQRALADSLRGAVLAAA